MTENAKNKTLKVNQYQQIHLLRDYKKLGVHCTISCDYDEYYAQLKTTNLLNDIDEYYRLSCVNLLVKGYDV